MTSQIEQDLREGVWYRDGSLLYTLKPHINAFGRPKGWANRDTVRIDGPDAEFVAEQIHSVLAAPPRPVDAERVEDLKRELSFFVSCVKALMRHTNPTNVNEGHAQQWFAVSDAIRMKIEPLIAALPASPAHSPDKAVTREGVFLAGHLDDAYSGTDRPNTAAPKTSLPIVPQGQTMTVRTALAPKPAGTEAGWGAYLNDLVGKNEQWIASYAEDQRQHVLANVAATPTPDSTGPAGAREALAEVLEPAMGYFPGCVEDLINACLDAVLASPVRHDGSLIDALKFYADPKNWIDTPPWEGDPEMITEKGIPVDHSQDGSPLDCGDRARKALAALTPPAPIGDPVRDGGARERARKRIQALGAALSRRDWSHTERAYEAIRDAHDRPEVYDAPTPASDVPDDAQTQESGLSLTALHEANIARQAEWCPDQVPDLSFRGNELAGETGEACNVIKKLERERQGWRGSRATLNDLAEELADVVICADLCAVTAGIDLSAAVIAKFNATSDKVGISVRLPAPADRSEGGR